MSYYCSFVYLLNVEKYIVVILFLCYNIIINLVFCGGFSMEVTPALDSFDNNKELTKGNKLGKALPDNFEDHTVKDKPKKEVKRYTGFER